MAVLLAIYASVMGVITLGLTAVGTFVTTTVYNEWNPHTTQGVVILTSLGIFFISIATILWF